MEAFGYMIFILFVCLEIVAWTPVSLVVVGATAQGLMLPFLALAALYLRHRRTELQLRPGMAWTIFLWLSALSMAAGGAYQVTE